MTPEQRLDRVERILVRLVKFGREVRSEFREKINILIDYQIRNEEIWRARSEAINEQIKTLAVAQTELAVAQAELSKSQKLTDQTLRALINSLRKGRNGRSSN